MPKTVVTWDWEEAFDKFGFDDGDGWNGTDLVAAFLEHIGFEVYADRWGVHNFIIRSIARDGIDVIPEDAHVGYDDPRTYLPADLVDKLDSEFAESREIFM